MRKIVLLIFLSIPFFGSSLNAQSISKKGYPEHFAAGALIGGTVSYFTYKKTDKKLKAWVFGFLASAGAGFLKEAVDPVFNKTRNWKDFQYTVFGGTVGASIVIPLK